MTARMILLVARPTLSGINERAMHRLAADVADRVADSVRVAHLDQHEPSIHEVLDEAVDAGTDVVTIVLLAVPADSYLTIWVARAVANWTETRAAGIDVRMAGPLGDSTLLVDALAELAGDGGSAVTASPVAFRSPSWSVLDIPERHLLVCRGPRCTVHGAGATHRALADAVKGTSAQVTPIGCLGPCNLGPLVIDNPAGTWHTSVGPPEAAALAERPPGSC